MKRIICIIVLCLLICNVQYIYANKIQFSFTKKIDEIVEEEKNEDISSSSNDDQDDNVNEDNDNNAMIDNENDRTSFRFKSTASLNTLMDTSDSMNAGKGGGKKKSKSQKKAAKKQKKAAKKKSKAAKKASKKCSKKGGKGCKKPTSKKPKKPSITKKVTKTVTTKTSTTTLSSISSIGEEPCIMCEYMIEMAQRMIKSQPRMMAGNGYSPGVVDFGSGSLGSFVEMKENEVHRKKASKQPSWYGRNKASAHLHMHSKVKLASPASSHSVFIETNNRHQLQPHEYESKWESMMMQLKISFSDAPEDDPVAKHEYYRKQIIDELLKRGYETKISHQSGDPMITKYLQKEAKKKEEDENKKMKEKMDTDMAKDKIGREQEKGNIQKQRQKDRKENEKMKKQEAKKRQSKKGGKGGKKGGLIDKGIAKVKEVVKKKVKEGISKLKCAMAKKLPKSVGKSLVDKHCPKPPPPPPVKPPTKPKPPGKKPPKAKPPPTKLPAPSGGPVYVDRNRGRWGPRDHNYINTLMEKDKEFEDIYKLVMDSFDDTCYHDFPREYQTVCKNMYHYGGEIVEMMLHNFQDWEICQKFMCPANFFDEL